jgi:uncharacterized repeat protein (TIGR01451 family)
MHNSTSCHHIGRLLGAIALVTSLLSLTAAPSPASAASGGAAPIVDARGATAAACPDDGLAAWHFLITPADATRQFAVITLDLDGISHTATDSMLVPNGGRTDDVFVTVPPGRTLDSIVLDTSSATITPDTGDATVVLADACEGAVADTAISWASSGTPDDVAVTAAVLPPPVPCPYEPGYGASDPACTPATTVEAVCVEISNAGDDVRWWYRLTNDEARAVTYEWVDGTATLDAGGSAVVASERDSVTLAVDGIEVAVADAVGEVCTQDVEIAKTVVGPAPDGATYTMLVSRLVGDTYLPEGAPFELRAGETVTIPIPSTFAPEGIRYAVTEVDPGEADASWVTPDSFVAMGHRDETTTVTVTNAYAAIELDKRVSSASDVQPGDELVYTLVATNAGGLTLDPVVIVDRLPMEVTYRSAMIVGGTGSCSLVGAGPPQVVRCELTGAVAPGAGTPPIELTVTVDEDVNDTQIVNQAMAVGTYDGTTAATDQAGAARVGPLPQAAALSCQPARGEVCALSARVGTGVVRHDPPAPLQESAGPVPTSSTTSTTTSTMVVASASPVAGSPTLPSTGNGTAQRIALVSVAALVAGLALLLGSRRAHQVG